MKTAIIGILITVIVLAIGCSTQEEALPTELTTEEPDAGLPADEPEALPQEPAVPEGETGQTATTPAQTTEGAPEGVTEGTCGVEALITVRGCEATQDLSNVEFTFQNTGRGDLDGVVYRPIDNTDAKLGESSDMSAWIMGESKTFSITMSSYEGATKIDFFPVSKGVICANQRSRATIANCK
ncbi:MAG TPA: hypothetical protein VJI75_04065 [Candidatus Nanoarchaeia archaeon]|nr:hypothetical protein [Candidatus Nanoarchaeia archaeon]